MTIFWLFIDILFYVYDVLMSQTDSENPLF